MDDIDMTLAVASSEAADEDKQNEDLLTKLQQDIDQSNSNYEDEIEPMLIKRNKIYDGDKDYYKEQYPELSEVSDLVTTDLADIIEWSMPSLMKSFFGGASIVNIKGVTADDDRQAEIMEDLINYQLTKLVGFFPIAYDWIKTAFRENAGVIKVTWDRQLQRDKDFVDVMAAEQLALLQSMKNVKIVTVMPLPDAMDLFKVEWETYRLAKNQPKIELVPACELRFSPDATDFNECNFVAHRKIVTIDYLRKMEKDGVYSNIDKVVDTGGDVKYTEWETEQNPNIDLDSRESETQTARRKVELYECYVKYDSDGDQIMEDWIVTLANDVIIRKEINTYGRHTFFMICPVRDPNRIWPRKGIGQFVCEIQGMKTAFLRQILNNTALNNDLPVFVDESQVNIMDVIERKKTIRVKGAPKDAVSFPPMQPMANWTMSLLEYLENAKEQATGITRYNQGLDSNSLNKMLDINTPIPMYDGTKKALEFIVDGDIIIGSDGQSTTVIKAHEIHNPIRAYEITFQSGEKIKAGGEHLWTVIRQSGKVETIDTDTIFDYMTDKKARLYIPRIRRGKQKIVSIRPIEVIPMRCLTVDAQDGLFCVGDRFTLTHNTATGIKIISQSSNQRLELIARIIMETGLQPFFRFLITLNQRFIDEAQVVRLTNEQLTIRPDDLQGNFDLDINASLGVGSQQAEMEQMQALLELGGKLGGIGIVTPENLYNIVKKLIEVMGYKDVAQFISEPKPKEPQPPEMKLAESLQIKFGDLPMAAQAQVLSKMGIQVSPQDLITERLLQAKQQTTELQAKQQRLQGPPQPVQPGRAPAYPPTQRPMPPAALQDGGMPPGGLPINGGPPAQQLPRQSFQPGMAGGMPSPTSPPVNNMPPGIDKILY